MTPPYISIITPTYNHEAYIEACLDSVLAQTYDDWEQIVIDDGSTDRTAELVAGKRDPRIRLIRQKNIGIDALDETYNRALSQAEGTFIAILEGDDRWPKDRLEILVEALSHEDEAVLAYGFTQLMSQKGEPFAARIPGQTLFQDYPDAVENRPVGSARIAMAHPDVLTFTFPAGVLLRSQALNQIGGFRQILGLPFVDLPTFAELALHGPFVFVDQVTGYWRQHLTSDTQRRDPERALAILRAYAFDTLLDSGSVVGLTEGQQEFLIEAWERALPTARFVEGRKRLLLDDRAGAREAFGGVIGARRADVALRLKAVIGWTCSLLGADFERLAAWKGRRESDMRWRFGLRGL